MIKLFSLKSVMTPRFWICLISALFFGLYFGGCAQRVHLDPSYKVAYQQLFSAQVMNTQNNLTPLNSDDAKRILEKRELKGSKSSRGGRRGRSYSRSSGSRSIQDIASSFNLD